MVSNDSVGRRVSFSGFTEGGLFSMQSGAFLSGSVIQLVRVLET